MLRGGAAVVASASAQLFGDSRALAAFERSGWNHYRLTQPDPLDKPSSVSDHLQWLREAGFQGVDVAWLYAGHAIFTATRAPQ